MTQRIIYPTQEGGIAVIIPADCGLTIEQIVTKDVPIGTPYLIIDSSLIPTDRSQREAWTADFSTAQGTNHDYT